MTDKHTTGCVIGVSPDKLVRPRRTCDPLTIAGASIGIIFLPLLGYGQRHRFLSGQNDFVQLFVSSQLSAKAALYDPNANKQVQSRLLGVCLESVYYSRPPFYAFVLRPLRAVGYKTAYWIFESLSVLALLVFLRIWTPRCRELLLFTGLFIPLLADILAGRDLLVVLMSAALAVEAMRQGRDFRAGLLH